MDVPIKIPDECISTFIENAIMKAVQERVDKICVDDIAKALTAMIKTYLSSNVNLKTVSTQGRVITALDKKLSDMIIKIDDNYLKDALLSRLISKCEKG